MTDLAQQSMQDVSSTHRLVGQSPRLLEAIRHALERDRAGRSEAAELGELRSRYATLTGREREVIVFMVKGMLNKQAAAELGVSEMTVKVHRHNIMQKMKVRSLPDLVRMMERVNAR